MGNWDFASLPGYTRVFRGSLYRLDCDFFVVPYMRNWVLASLCGYIGIFRASLHGELRFGQSTWVDLDISWFP